MFAASPILHINDAALCCFKGELGNAGPHVPQYCNARGVACNDTILVQELDVTMTLRAM